MKVEEEDDGAVLIVCCPPPPNFSLNSPNTFCLFLKFCLFGDLIQKCNYSSWHMQKNSITMEPSPKSFDSYRFSRLKDLRN